MKAKRDKILWNWERAVLIRGQKVLSLAMLVLLFSTTSMLAEGSVDEVNMNQQVQRKISGTVVDKAGAPVAGASISVLNTSTGAFTDTNGHFELTLSEGSDVLVVSFVGMKTQRITVGSNTVLNVTLEEEAVGLNEIVVIGYGTSKKQDLSAAVATVSNLPSLKETPVSSTAAMLQGQIPGVNVTFNGGHPTSTPIITIRGIGSKYENVLYVVDGVPGAPYNPDDVTSVTVLKDAASAAIYGVNAGSAGVVLITTRKPQSGAPTVEYNVNYGFKSAWKKLQSLTGEQEAGVANLAADNAGATRLDGWNKDLDPYVYVTRTDWMNEIFRTSTTQRHNISISGGNDKISNMFQARWENDEGTLLNTYNKNVSLRFNSTYQLNKYVKLNQNLFWNNNDNRDAETQSGYSGVVLSAIYMPRSATVYYDDGSFGGVGPRDSEYLGIHGDAINPVATLLRNTGYYRTSDVLSTTDLNISNIIKGLQFTSRFSYEGNNTFYKYFSYSRTEPGKPNTQNELTYTSGKTYKWVWENTLNYDKVFGKHNVSAMLSTTSREDGYRGFGLYAFDFEREDKWAQFLVNAATYNQQNPWDSETKDRNLAYVGRGAYSYADRFFVTGSYRIDIAGRLPQGKKSKGFPGVTAAWKLSSEPWFPEIPVNLLKLRASWGRIGNLASIGQYYGYSTLSSTTTRQFGEGAYETVGAYISESYNKNLSWETSEQKDLGMDLSLFDNKLNITTDYFWKETYDLIKRQDVDWTSSYGVTAPYINQGKISNKGWEFAADWKAKAGEFTYGVGFNFATLKNKVVSIDNNPDTYWTFTDYVWRGTLNPYRSKVGEPYYGYYLVKSAGIFQSDAEVAAYTKDGNLIQPNARPGDLKFVDHNKDGKIDDGDRQYLGSPYPKFTYGFNGSLSWKNWDLNVLFQGVAGVKIFNVFKESTLNAAEQGYNRWNKILDAWSETNKDSNIPIISASDKNNNFGTASDWYLEKGDYLRLKNLLLGYNFKKMPWGGSLRVYFSGQNLLTFTKYSGFDPEVGQYGFDGGQYPVSRVYSFGANIKF